MEHSIWGLSKSLNEEGRGAMLFNRCYSSRKGESVV